MKKGGGTGPVKPWQPIRPVQGEKGAKSDRVQREKISVLFDVHHLQGRKLKISEGHYIHIK